MNRCVVWLAGVDLVEVNSGVELSESVAGRGAENKGGEKNCYDVELKKIWRFKWLFGFVDAGGWSSLKVAVRILKSGISGT